MQLAGINVLLVEDEVIVAMGHADHLKAAGASIVGPCATARQAIEALQTTDVDVAVIDFLLADRNSEPLQTELQLKGVPFVVVTAYPSVLVRQNEGQIILHKPVTADLLCSTVRSLVQAK